VIARPSLGGTPLPPLLAGATVARNAEYARLATDARTLESIAGASGGRVLGWDEAAGLFDRSALEPRRTRTPLWPVLLGWTVVVFLLDVGTRRIAWDRLLPERSGEREMARIAAGAGQRVAALRGARTKEDGADRAPMPTAAALSDEDADRLRREARAARYRSQAEAYKKKVAGASTQTGDAAQAQKTDKVEKPAPETGLETGLESGKETCSGTRGRSQRVAGGEAAGAEAVRGGAGMADDGSSGGGNPDHAARFTERAEDYAAHRPSYPDACIDAMLRGMGTPGMLAAADVGAGTGIMARLIAARGPLVVAIEPNGAMRAKAHEHERVLMEDGTAEATGLRDASVDLVVCAQAFHWFDPPAAFAEFRRVLKGTGRLALVWNEVDATTEIGAGYREILDGLATDETPRVRYAAQEDPFAGTDLFDDVKKADSRWRCGTRATG
jgi:hypothetical protein